MKISAFIGSPRKMGNVDTIATEFLNSAEEEGAKVAKFYLNDLNISGCQACFACRYSAKCAVKDDMTPLYEQIIDSDVIVIASPIFMWQMTGQTKTFLDRLFVFLENDYEHSRFKKPKRTILIFSQAKQDQGLYSNHIKETVGVLEKVGFQVEKVIHATNVFRLGEVSYHSEIMNDARTYGKQLATI